MPVVFATARARSMLAAARKSLSVTATALAMNSTPLGCAEAHAQQTRTQTVRATMSTRASVRSMRAESATDRERCTPVAARRFRPATATVPEISSTPSGCVEVLAVQMQTATVHAMTSMPVSDLSTCAASATARAPFTVAAVRQFRPVTATALAMNSTPLGYAEAHAQQTQTVTVCAIRTKSTVVRTSPLATSMLLLRMTTVRAPSLQPDMIAMATCCARLSSILH